MIHEALTPLGPLVKMESGNRRIKNISIAMQVYEQNPFVAIENILKEYCHSVSFIIDNNVVLDTSLAQRFAIQAQDGENSDTTPGRTNFRNILFFIVSGLDLRVVLLSEFRCSGAHSRESPGHWCDQLTQYYYY